MSFWNKIVQIFSEHTILVVLQIIFFAVLFYYLFRTTKLGGASWVNIIIMLLPILLIFILPANSATERYIYVLICVATLSIVVIVLFQAEVRRHLYMPNLLKKDAKSMGSKHKNKISEEEIQGYINEIVKALFNLSKQNIGALVILSNDNIPQIVLDSGVLLNAQISSQLIESIFNTKSPLHDGAMLINNAKIQSVGCFLQLSRDTTIPKELGTRHRAGIGITETTNVTALIVSEETGVISIVQHGKIQRYIDHETLQKTLKDYFWKEL